MNTLFYLIGYKNKYGYIHVAFCHKKTKKWVHCSYPSKTFNELFKKKSFTLHRQIMHDEIVIETDMQYRHDNKIINVGIINKCLTYKWSFSSWISGNKSYHVHMFFPQLLKIKKAHNIKKAKQLFMKWFFENHIDDMKVDMSLCGNHLVRAEYQTHEKTNRSKIPLVEHYNDKQNKIPKQVILDFNKLKKKKKKIHIPTTTLPCVKMLLRTKLKDGRKRAAFILISNLKGRMSKQQLKDLMMLWSNKKQGGAVSYSIISSIIRGQYKTKNQPGCNYIKEVLKDIGSSSFCKGCMLDKEMWEK